jgi:hypothetical protein
MNRKRAGHGHVGSARAKKSTVKVALEPGDSAPTPTGAEPGDILAVFPWEGMLRAGKAFGDPPGMWTLNAWLDGGTRLDPDAIDG